MKGYLLDTNVLLIAQLRSKTLSGAVLGAIQSGANVLSVASYWEIVIKSMKGSLVVGDLQSWWPDALKNFAATPLLIRPEHISAIRKLPNIHQDPFDRLLIAQAIVEELTLVTTDAEIQRYASQDLKVIF